jgi:O-antigen ligase
MRDHRKLAANKKIETILFALFILFLPTQLGKHYWPDFSLVLGLRIDYLSPTLYVTDILLILLFFVWIANQLRTQKTLPVFRKSRGAALYTSFTAFLIISVVVSGNIGNGFYHIAKFLECSFAAYYTAKAVGKTISLENLAGILSIGVIGESLLAAIQYTLHSSVGGLIYFLGERTFNSGTPGIANASINGELILRPYGTFSHPNVLAGYLVITMLMIIFYLFPSKNKLMKSLATTALFLGTSALLLTLSRVAITLWLLFILSFLIWQIRRTFTKSAKSAIVSILIFVLLLFSAWFTFSQTLSPRFLQTALTEEAVVQRSALITVAWHMITMHPLVGVGLGNFLPALAIARSPLSLELYLQPVHNIFLLVAAETGLLGLSVFGWFTYSMYLKLLGRMRRSKTKSREILGMISLLTTLVILGQFDHYLITLQQGQLLFAMIVGLCFTDGKTPLTLGVAKNTRSL